MHHRITYFRIHNLIDYCIINLQSSIFIHTEPFGVLDTKLDIVRMYVHVYYDLSIQKSRYDEILKGMEEIEGELQLLYTSGIANALSSPLISTNQQPHTNQLIATNW